MKRRRKLGLAALLLWTVCILSMLAACAGKEEAGGASQTGAPSAESGAESPAAAGGDLKPVELSWYLPFGQIPARLQEIEDAVNRITKSKINATVRIKAVNDYSTKMNTVLASGEPVDILWTSNWSFSYVENQQKGAFLALDELLDQYAPEVKSSMPQFVWDATKIQGKIYGVPNYQIVTNQEFLGVQNRFLEKYNFDPSVVKKPEDIEPLLEKIKAGEGKNVIPFTSDRRGKFIAMPHTFGLEFIMSNTVGAIRWSEPTQVIDFYNSPEYERYLDMIHRWYDKGYINEDAPTLKSTTDISRSGKEATWYHNVLTPGNESNVKLNNGGYDVTFVPMTEVFAGTNTITSTMQAISSSSKNPERAMMFINLINTDKELYNLLCYGIEGTDYTKNADNTIKLNKESGYYVNSNWIFGNTFNALLVEGQKQENLDKVKQNNEAAAPSPIIGFQFLTGPVLAEVANVNSVIDQYGPGLNTGAIDPKEKLAEFRSKLAAAGMDKIIAEMQKQLDEFYRTKG
ncbi:ABC transporter substrate-binding protein [Cohnella hongkongensis]|uniref:ABC transporter substrate-binding protein n=1 Tax=Cohnella hongkongensis TaxID=178337 RepID=A0ABV9FC04_9BACL